ncbi:MAG TPA: polymer-forming cytoskeletal protein [Bryobacteraceae bacterium]|jgi:cytoskeletal protein CcmA (bactofilin family)|nr:polymer-forming cytoskeletal protein [Bryobacteraceae bacterium]
MWGKQNDGQMIQNPPAQPVQPAPAAAPAIQQHHQAPPPAPASTPTVFGKSMKIIGEVTSDEELYLDGDLDGKLNLRNRLTVGPNSKVNANIKAQEIIVFGTIRGNVESESRVSLRTGASIVGDIKTAGIVIEDGAYFKGGIDISKNGESKQSQNGDNKPAPKAQSASQGTAQGAAAGQKR